MYVEIPRSLRAAHVPCSGLRTLGEIGWWCNNDASQCYPNPEQGLTRKTAASEGSQCHFNILEHLGEKFL
jgi:hypothetical protein